MTINEMFDELENKTRDTYIVTLKYKYDFEENYVIENQILEYDSVDDSYAWLNDWFEGQTDVEVLGYMPLGDVDTTKLLTCEGCISGQVVLDILKDKWNIFSNANDAMQESIDTIEALLPVTPSYNSIKTELKPCGDCISREDAMARTKSGQPDLGINFNDKIKVKLTDLGKDIFYHQYDWILKRNPKTRAYIKPHYPKVDEEGYTTFLLWEFMQLYGKYIGMAAPNVILPLEIIKCEDE